MRKDARYYYGLANDLLGKKELEKAIHNLQLSLSLEEHFKTYLVLAQVLRGLGRMEEAYPCFVKAQELNPKNDKAVAEYALFMISRGEREKARTALMSILERNPTYGPAQKLLSELNVKMV